MAYKRQTSFSPFTSKRSVSTRESKDQLALAKALESQRKQTVKEFAGASSQQIEELGRIDKNIKNVIIVPIILKLFVLISRLKI